MLLLKLTSIKGDGVKRGNRTTIRIGAACAD